jgi:hypothetical protein
MPFQRKGLPTEPSAPARARSPRGYRSCSTCRESVLVGALSAGQCRDCTGHQARPLGGEGGRFLPGLTPSSAPTRRGGAQ